MRDMKDLDYFLTKEELFDDIFLDHLPSRMFRDRSSNRLLKMLLAKF